ncbi:MAG: type I secretion system permease/ATPase [Limnohabitans sp.]|jgi:ATP-binding cassette, subfamily C, bacterial exporter for protease/lipase
MKQLSASFRDSTIAQVLLQFRREIGVITLFSAVINVLMLSPTLYMLQVFDRVMISRSEITLLVLTLMVVFFYAVQSFSEIIRSRLIIGSGLRLDAALSEPVFRATFANQLRHGGRAPAQGFADLMTIRQWLTGHVVFAFFDLPWAPVYLVVMFMLHPMLGWLTILFMLILAAFAWWTSTATSELTEAAQQEGEELATFVHTKLRNAEVIEAHGMSPNFQARWWKRQAQTLGLQTHANDIEERFSVTSKELRAFMQSLALGAGAWLAIRGEISMGAMIAANLLMARATSPIDQIVGGWNSFINVRQTFQRLEALLKSDTTPLRHERTPALDRVAISLRHVVARAPGRTAPILKGVSAEFPAGRIYAVLGSSGAGKSTLGKVLTGIWPDTEGQVLVNGVDIRSLDREELGPHIGYLPQDVELFAGSAGENIARMETPDSDRVIEAAQLTGTHDMILRMPRGYDSPIGEGGSALSGGQRQRLGLARAIYGDPRLIVLDEPNANLDEVGEEALVRALQTMRDRGATIFLITHRPGIVDIADSIVLMADGQITAYGDAASLRSEMAARLGHNAPVPSPAAAIPQA